MSIVSRCRQDNLKLMSNSYVQEVHVHMRTCKSDLLYFKVQQSFLKGVTNVQRTKSVPTKKRDNVH